MAHECDVCGMYCYCDCEDMDQPCPDDCTCDHEGSGLDEDGCEIDGDEYILDTDCGEVEPEGR